MKRAHKYLIAAGAAAAACVCIILIVTGSSPDSGGKLSDSMFSPAKDYSEVYEVLTQYGGYRYIDYVYEDDMPLYADEETADTSKTTGDSDHSETNVMVEGVDESDTVITDGKYIYCLDYSGIKITDIRNGALGESVFLTPDFESPADYLKEMYVDNDRLIAITTGYDESDYDLPADDDYYYYNYDYKEHTTLLVYDISDPLSPEYTGCFSQSGAYGSSRKIGDKIYVITEEYSHTPVFEAKEALQETNLKYWLPTVNDQTLSSGSIYLGKDDFRGAYGTLISSFDVNNPEKVIDAKYFLGNYFELYVSTQNAYLYSAHYGISEDFTQILKLALNDGKITPSASVKVLGYVNDRFALNEADGYLRVLTTNSQASTLFVLDENLKIAGRLDKIAPDEVVYAARYAGDIVYFVTYRNMDPLFCVDLSDPENPVILGELELPGYSDYLHLWDESRLLGIGYDYDEEGIFKGMKLAMFDISDPAAPALEGSYYLPEVSSISGLYDYKKLLVDPRKNLIGFSAYSNTDRSDSYYLFAYDNDFKVLMDIDTGFWESRGIYSGDYFYTVSGTDIRAFNMADDFKEVS